MVKEKKQIPFREGMWATSPDGGSRLVGSMCPSCGELFFPRKGRGACVHCQAKGLKDIELCPFGKIASFTTVMQRPTGGFYQGPLPYSYGLVDLNDGVRIETHIKGDHEKIEIGMRVKLIITTLYEEEGKDIQIFSFQPMEEQEELEGKP